MKPQQHILVIRLSAMGDVAMLVPVLRVFAEKYPEVKLTVLTKPFFKPLFSTVKNVSIVTADITGNHKGLLGIYTLSRELKTLHITKVADTHNVLRSKLLRFFMWFSGVKSAVIDKGRAEKRALTQANGHPIKQLKKTPQRYADVFKKLGFPIKLATHIFPVRERLTTSLQKIVGNMPKKLIGIAPFAAHNGKMYPLPLMKEVIEDLDIMGKYKIFLFGGGKKEITQLSRLAEIYTNVESVAGKLPLEEELALISNLDVMLAMDSGNGHLAALYDTPVITLWGVTHPYAGFVPFNQPNSNQLVADRDQFPLIPTSVYGNKYPKGYENAMATIPPRLVVEKVLEVV